MTLGTKSKRIFTNAEHRGIDQKPLLLRSEVRGIDQSARGLK